MINVQQGIKYKIYIKKLFQWIYNNGVMNLSVVIIYSIVGSTIKAFSSLLKPFDPKRRVSTII